MVNMPTWCIAYQPTYLTDFKKNKTQWQSSFDGLVTTYNASCASRIHNPHYTAISRQCGRQYY
ncbi:MAG: hypothetical protein WDM90_20775 [Ferruginibacter sp.]